jgi:hypothetical protein
MSYQTIVNNATTIQINNKPISRATMSRSNRLKTALRGEAIYRFNVAVGRAFKWDAGNRAMLQILQQQGRTVEEEITLSATSGMSYIMGYAGTLDSTQLSALTIDSIPSNATLKLDTASTTGITAGDTLFDRGDYIQPANSRYTYEVTAPVFGSAIALGLVDVPVHRSIYPASSDGGNNIVGAGVNVANNCTFHVKCLTAPTHTLQPGGLFTFDGNFEFVEVIL